jgi:hypothetical protein
MAKQFLALTRVTPDSDLDAIAEAIAQQFEASHRQWVANVGEPSGSPSIGPDPLTSPGPEQPMEGDGGGVSDVEGVRPGSHGDPHR